MKHLALISFLVMMVISVAHAKDVRVGVSNAGGTLIFSNMFNDAYRSVVFENSTKQRFYIFDSGLEFSYRDGLDPYLSPDKKFFFVNFSEVGSVETTSSSDESNRYMCAFIRMSDGCVVRVETGGICGGEWDATSVWHGLGGLSTKDLDSSQITVKKVFREYSSGSKDASVSSIPKILKYLPEGTAFDNLLACDPVTAANQGAYNNLLKLLRQDGDLINAKKVARAIRSTKSDDPLRRFGSVLPRKSP